MKTRSVRTKAELIDRLKAYDLNVKISGAWVWVSGNANSFRAELREMGLRYSNKRSQWYWKEPEKRTRWRPSRLKVNNDDWANPNHRLKD